RFAKCEKTVGAWVVARAADAPVDTVEFDGGGFPVYDIRPHALASDDERVYLDIHGGGFLQGAGEACRAMGIGAAGRVGTRVWAVDYRMPPDHPFPSGLDDVLETYRLLLE